MHRPLSFLLTVALLFAGCKPATEAPPSSASTETHAEAIERWETVIETKFPGEAYVTNAYIPAPGVALDGLPPPEVATLRLGLPWVLNDEAAPWILARDRGYFAEAGLEVELLPGGPGKDHLRTLAGGKVELAVINDGSKIVKYRASATPVDAILVSTVLQQSPSFLLTIDWETSREVSSDRTYTPEDLRGKTVGMATESEFQLLGILDRAGIDRSEVTIRRAGNEPNVLAAKGVDFMGSWVVNQPRMLEAAGFKNWSGFFFAPYLFTEYADATVVQRAWAEAHPATLQRYHWALRRAIEDMLSDPATTSAEVARALGDTLSAEQVLWRFEQQASLIRGEGDAELLSVDPEVLNHIAAYLAHYGIIEL